jgi:hypothetical protein
MRGSKLILIAILFCFFQCKKDKKDELSTKLLPDGKYILYLETSPQGVGSTNYFLKDNVFYVMRRNTSDTICFDREAGQIFLNSLNKLDLAPLQFGESSNPCEFANDNYGGDTMIYHFYNIVEASNNLNKKYLKGDFYILINSGHPFSRVEGKFSLGPS